MLQWNTFPRNIDLISSPVAFGQWLSCVLVGSTSPWSRPLALVTSSLPLAVPALVATLIQRCFWLFFLDFARNVASSSLACPAKRLMSCNHEATYYNTIVPLQSLLPIMKYCWLSEMKNPVRHFYFGFSYLFFHSAGPLWLFQFNIQFASICSWRKNYLCVSVYDKSARSLLTAALISLRQVAAKAGLSQLKSYSFYINEWRPKPPPFLWARGILFLLTPTNIQTTNLQCWLYFVKTLTAPWAVYSHFNSVLSVPQQC